jgi:hypothetical protein
VVDRLFSIGRGIELLNALHYPLLESSIPWPSNI